MGTNNFGSDLDEMLKQAPTLTLDPIPQEKQEVAEVEEKVEEEAERIAAQVVLTPEEQQMVDQFAAQIDLTNTQQILQYGVGSQKKIADFSETALSSVRTKDLGEIGQMLTSVVTELRMFEEDEETKGFLGFFKKSANRLESLKAKYDKADDNIDKIVAAM